MHNKKGFTLIELLVVIAIIGILSAIGLVSLNGAREKARDSKRQSDLSSIKSALALYYDDNNSQYPGTGSTSTGGAAWTGGLDAALVPTYTGALPTAPAAGNTTGNQVYNYVVSTNRDNYYLFTRLEGTVTGVATPYWYSNSKGATATVATAPGTCGNGTTACP